MSALLLLTEHGYKRFQSLVKSITCKEEGVIRFVMHLYIKLKQVSSLHLVTETEERGKTNLYSNYVKTPRQQPI